jgi:hypothetical protein
LEKKSMKSSVLAMSRTSGPIRMPRKSSRTTTGGAKRLGTTATVTAATAAITTIAKKESVSTWIPTAGRSYGGPRPGGLFQARIRDGPC